MIWDIFDLEMRVVSWAWRLVGRAFGSSGERSVPGTSNVYRYKVGGGGVRIILKGGLLGLVWRTPGGYCMK